MFRDENKKQNAEVPKTVPVEFDKINSQKRIKVKR